MFKRGKLGGLEGGQYRPLTDSDIRSMHEAIVRILSEIGIKVANKKGFDLFKAKGLKTDDEKQLRNHVTHGGSLESSATSNAHHAYCSMPVLRGFTWSGHVDSGSGSQ